MSTSDRTVTLRRVVRLWLPLAASWAMMGVELPLLTAVVARMDDPRVHLAAYGSVVFPISLVIEGPIIMLLAASTALCSDARRFRQVRRFMMAAGAALTALHVAIAFTPLFDLVAVGLLDAPDAIVEPARIGLRIMTPWTWSIAYRRFYQGILIKHEQSGAVGVGTVVRLVANASTLLVLSAIGGLPGIVVGASGVAAGVLAEAAFAGWRVRPVLRELVPEGAEPALTLRGFLGFYVPLAMTPLITLVIQPMGAGAMNRLPEAIASTAAWPAVHGFVFILRSVGMAYNEVVVTLIGERGGVEALRAFHRRLATGVVAIIALVAATPLAHAWFEGVSGLDPELATVCRVAVALSIPMPAYAVFQSWYQGALVRAGTTRPITEAVMLYFALSGVLLVVGVSLQATRGIDWAIGSFVTAGIAQTLFLAWRARAAIRRFAAV